MPSLSMEVKRPSELHTRITTAVQDRIRISKQERERNKDRWDESEKAAQAYIPERDVDSVRRKNREAGKPEYTTITIPYTYAVMLASHTYWTTVFMSRNPIHQFQGRHGETENQVMALEALIDYQVQVGGLTVPYYIWLYDVGRYGESFIATDWREEFSSISYIEEVEETMPETGIATGKMKRRRVTDRVAKYKGNRVKNIRPHDFFPDPRLPLHRFQEGEFCAILTSISWNQMLKGADRGQYINIEEARRLSNLQNRREGSEAIELPDNQSWTSQMSKDKNAADNIEVYECHIEIVPKEWKLGESSYPEKWVFTVTTDFSVVVGCQPLGYRHDMFPFDILELEPEGYSIYNRSYTDILEPIQHTLDWLINSHFYNVRKALNNEWVVDPSKVNMRDLLNPLPGNMIRLKPTAYGTDVRTAVHQLQTQDITRAHMTDVNSMLQLGERVSGVNDAVMGMAHPSSRRSATEIRSTNTFSANRLKTTAEYFSAEGFGPHTQKLIQNSQQYYSGENKYRIVGDLAISAGPQFAEVNPQMISGFYDFVPVDGTLPVDRYAQANLWRELLMTASKIPGILESYDVGRIFAWVAQLTGLKNINQFKVQVVPDEMAAQGAQAGNLVNMAEARGGPAGPPVQVSGMGDTF